MVWANLEPQAGCAVKREIPYDGVDQDCDGVDLIDRDADGVAATAAGGDDCDDTDSAVFPGAPEVPYDGVDQDCDGADRTDVDGDGQDAQVVGGDDCDDHDAGVYTGATELSYDGIDQDCDGADLTDVDADGQGAVEAGGVDCDDGDATVYRGATEIPYDDIDQDCNGADLTDVDGDGHDAATVGGDDCDDADASVHPGAVEVEQDGIDENCDGGDDTTPGASITPTPDATFSGAPRLGTSSTGVDDLDGDGVPDLAISSIDTVYLLSGAGRGPGGVDAAMGTVDLGGDDRHVLFDPILGIGDVDGDGRDDMLTAAEAWGTVKVFAVVPGTTAAPLLSAVGGDYFGAGFTPLLDVTGDGTPDLAVGEPGSDRGGANLPGQLYVYSGADRGEDRDEDAWLTVGGAGTHRLGAALASGDFDGDGADDLVIGEGNARGAGRIWIVTDLAAGLFRIEDVGGRVSRSTGLGVVSAGDADGDGLVDVLAGSYAPGACLLTGLDNPPASLDRAAACFIGSGSDFLFGVVVAGDLDGDGIPDVVGTEYGGHIGGAWDYGPANAYVFRGLFAGTIATTDAAAVVTDDNPVLDTYVRLSVSLPGDLDGDGYGELPFGDPYFRETTGAAWLYSGLLRP